MTEMSGHWQDTYFKNGYPLEIISARTIKRNEFFFSFFAKHVEEKNRKFVSSDQSGDDYL